MSSVVMQCLAVLVAVTAIGRINKGMSIGVEAAADLNAAIRAEYAAHVCGSLAAAGANLAAAATALAALYPSEYDDWSNIAADLSSSLPALAGDQDCDRTSINLHQQSPGTTPLEFPNTVYRLNWPSAEDSRG